MYITGWTKSLIFYICERHRSCAAIVKLTLFGKYRQLGVEIFYQSSKQEKNKCR